jgi:hypothetical protein
MKNNSIQAFCNFEFIDAVSSKKIYNIKILSFLYLLHFFFFFFS